MDIYELSCHYYACAECKLKNYEPKAFALMKKVEKRHGEYTFWSKSFSLVLEEAYF
jgi:hypothetical protein